MHTDYTVIIPRRGINDEGKGKKHALHRLILEAPSEYVHLMDDDVIPPPQLPDTQADLVILPLRMESQREHPTIIEQLQTAEYAAIQALTILSAQHGHPVMCSGANLLVRRNRWLESFPDIHPELPSGDDMFLLESFKRRRLTIAVADAPEYEAVVRPLTSLRDLLRQRMRWAGKAPAYHDRDILLCGTAVLLANLLQILFPPILLIKFPIELHLIRSREKQTDTATCKHKQTRRIPFLIILLLELLYPLYMLTCLIGGIFKSRQKKESPSF